MIWIRAIRLGSGVTFTVSPHNCRGCGTTLTQGQIHPCILRMKIESNDPDAVLYRDGQNVAAPQRLRGK